MVVEGQGIYEALPLGSRIKWKSGEFRPNKIEVVSTQGFFIFTPIPGELIHFWVETTNYQPVREYAERFTVYIHYTQIAVYRFMRSGGFLCGGPSDLFCGWVSDPPADDIFVLVCCVNIDIYIITLALCVYMFTLHEIIDFHICRYYGKRY